MPFDIATNEGFKYGGALRSGKLAFDPVVSGCLPHSLAVPLRLRGGDFCFGSTAGWFTRNSLSAWYAPAR